MLRFLSGFFGVSTVGLDGWASLTCSYLQSVPTTNSGAVCGDIWNAREVTIHWEVLAVTATYPCVSQRGTAMSFYSVATFAGVSTLLPIEATLY